MAIRELTTLSIIVRIVSAVLIGGIIGVERASKNRPAGLRTYMLVCVGACLMMLTNQYVYQGLGVGDPVRLGAQVVSGIGFLGAGTIIVTRHNQISGLTTAAGLWASAGVGLALGVGFYEAAFATALSIVLILTVLGRMDNVMRKHTRELKLYIEMRTCVSLGVFIKKVQEMDLEIESIQPESDCALEEGGRAMFVALKSKNWREHKGLLDEIRKIEGVTYLEKL